MFGTLLINVSIIFLNSDGTEYPTGIGMDKKSAEQSAAQNALTILIG